MARVIIIDDDPDMRALLEQVLTSAGHEVVLAADGAEGMKGYHLKPADLVITDLYMPNQDGLETIQQLRTLAPGVPIIAMSGRTAAPRMLSIARTVGAIWGLQKPFSPGEILSAVEKALRG